MEMDDMQPPSLKKLLDATDTESLLAQFSRLADGSVTLAVFDQRGQTLASYPAGADDRLAEAAAAVRRTVQPLANHGCRAMPILAHDQLVGVLVGAPSSAPGLDDALGGVLSVLSTLVSQAIERKTLAQELLDRYREINLLYRLHETIGGHIDLKEVAASALAESVRIVKADGGALFLRRETTGHLYLLTTEGNAPNLSHGQGVPNWVAQEGRPAIVNDVTSDLRHTPSDGSTELQATALQSLLCVPLSVQDKVLGVLCLCNKRRGEIFSAGDEKLLMVLASQTAVAIENAQQVAARERQLRRQIQELRIEIDQVRKQQAVKTIVDSDYFQRLAETAQQWREDFDQV
jgi:GAF domain-containing protein